MRAKNFIFLSGLLLLVSIFLFLIQNSVVQWLSVDHFFYYPVWGIYLFHFLITLFIFSLLYLIGKVIPRYIGFTFMGGILFKMVAAIIFLLPLIKVEGVSKIPDFCSFFVPYFIFLFLEVLLAMRVLRHSGN